MLTAPSNTLILLMQQVLEKRCHTADLLPARLELSSGWWLHDGNSVSGVDAPTVLVHRAAVRPAQGNQVGQFGWPRDRLPAVGRGSCNHGDREVGVSDRPRSPL